MSYTDFTFPLAEGRTFGACAINIHTGIPYGILPSNSEGYNATYKLYRPKTAAFEEVSICSLPFTDRPWASAVNLVVGDPYVWIIFENVGADDSHLGLVCVNGDTMEVVSSREDLTSSDIHYDRKWVQCMSGIYLVCWSGYAWNAKFDSDCVKSSVTAEEGVLSQQYSFPSNAAGTYESSPGSSAYYTMIHVIWGDPNFGENSPVVGNWYPNKCGRIFAIDDNYVWGILENTEDGLINLDITKLDTQDDEPDAYIGNVGSYAAEAGQDKIPVPQYYYINSYGDLAEAQIGPAALIDGEFIFCVATAGGYAPCGWVVLDSTLHLVHRLMSIVPPPIIHSFPLELLRSKMCKVPEV